MKKVGDNSLYYVWDLDGCYAANKLRSIRDDINAILSVHDMAVERASKAITVEDTSSAGAILSSYDWTEKSGQVSPLPIVRKTYTNIGRGGRDLYVSQCLWTENVAFV
jgi:hypothetical protein